MDKVHLYLKRHFSKNFLTLIEVRFAEERSLIAGFLENRLIDVPEFSGTPKYETNLTVTLKLTKINDLN